MELDYFKDILFDLINEWDQDIQDIVEDSQNNTLWIVMGDGSVFRLECAKEPFSYNKPE